MTTTLLDFAILAPVPLEHLESGEEIARATGFVAFGSLKWELFRKADELRNGMPVPVLFYPSFDYESPGKLSYEATWAGWYVDSVESRGGAHPDGMRHRPPSTAKYRDDNEGHWAVFWHVRDLTRLEQSIPITKLRGHAKGTWRKNSAPRGPELIEMPADFHLEPPTP
ncbi:MAG: hypothetical protein HY875_17745 [Chloroflexi bacterium]|nr:hypothetical protein [Chloroflexota bacterium]